MKKVKGHLEGLEAMLQPYLEIESEPPLELMREITRYERLVSKLTTFAGWVDETWVAELDDPEKWEFKPTFVRRFGDALTKHGQKVLAMSATMLSARDWAWNLGIEE